MKNKINAFILEDIESNFKTIENCLKGCNFFPTTSSKKVIPNNHLDSDFHYLKNLVFRKLKSSSEDNNEEWIKKRNENFDLLHNQFSDEKKHYDLYIVDIELKDKAEDNLGEDFLNYLEFQDLSSDSLIIILTVNSSPPPIIELSDSEYRKRYKFIQKVSNWEGELNSYLKSVFIQNTKAPDAFESFAPLPYKKTHKDWFHHIIQSVFVLLTAITIILVSQNVYKKDLGFGKKNGSTQNEFVNTKPKIVYLSEKTVQSIVDAPNASKDSVFKEALKTPDLSISNEKSSDLEILKFSEHLFLYLIPLFIIFGFYNYYYNGFRRVLLKLPITGEMKDDRVGEKSIFEAKKLFISSVLSYSIIKVIEEIFVREQLNLLNVCTYGIFLLLLMSYIFISNKSH